MTYADVLADMVEWWEARSVQLRVDCIVANGAERRAARDDAAGASPRARAPRADARPADFDRVSRPRARGRRAVLLPDERRLGRDGGLGLGRRLPADDRAR